MDESASAWFYTTEPIWSEDHVQELLAVFEEAGLVGKNGPDTVVDPRSLDLDLESESNLNLFWGDEPIRKQIRLDFRREGLPESALHIATSADHLASPEYSSDADGYAGFAGLFLDLIRKLAIALDPVYVSTIHPQTGTRPDPTDVIPLEVDFELDRIPWLSVYSESLLNRFGWEGRIMDAPAWKVERLDTGGVLLIKTKEPWGDVSRDHSVDRYLLDEDDSVL